MESITDHAPYSEQNMPNPITPGGGASDPLGIADGWQAFVDASDYYCKGWLNSWKVIPEKDLPDYIAVSASLDNFIGGGIGLDYTFGYVKGDGFFSYPSFRTGSGFGYTSIGASIVFGKHYGLGMPSILSTTGVNSYQNFSIRNFSLTFQQDLTPNYETGLYNAPGLNWRYIGFGISRGGKGTFGGSFGTSITPQSLLIKY